MVTWWVSVTSYVTEYVLWINVFWPSETECVDWQKDKEVEAGGGGKRRRSRKKPSFSLWRSTLNSQNDVTTSRHASDSTSTNRESLWNVLAFDVETHCYGKVRLIQHRWQTLYGIVRLALASMSWILGQIEIPYVTIWQMPWMRSDYRDLTQRDLTVILLCPCFYMDDWCCLLYTATYK